jgi:Spy/CpxP family protein refolding chaperone
MRFASLAALLMAGPALAQHAPPGHHTPYAGLEARPIKALSEQQIADLQAGRGMGLALAAELNGYPGPMHVLELADRLGLTAEQRARTEALFAAMREEAIGLGEAVIRREAELNRLFAERTADLTGLHAVVAEIGLKQASLRVVHLKYHLAMRELLTPEQTATYQALRGYGAR